MSAASPFPGPINIFTGMQIVSGTCSDQDEVHAGMGNLMRTVVVANVPTVGLPLNFFLTYDSQSDGSAAPMGYKWRHNLQMQLSGFGTGTITFTSEAGGIYMFDESTGVLDLPQTYYFLPVYLTQSPWRVNFYPDQGYYEFDDNGVLVAMGDAHGNRTTVTHNADGTLASVTEPTGRTLSFTSDDQGRLITVTDPMGNTTTFDYDSQNNLTSVIGPAGCQLAYGYGTPSNHLLTSRSDAYGNVYRYAYDTSFTPPRISSITDPDFPDQPIAYAYTTPNPYEATGDNGAVGEIHETKMTDADGEIWTYHFTLAWGLWRIIDPMNHWRRFYWSSEQKLLYSTAGHEQITPFEPGPNGTTTVGGPRDNIYNSFLRYGYDGYGNMLFSADPTGKIDTFGYDSNNRLVSAFPGQAQLGVQGFWVDQFGKDGYLLCAWNPDNTDIPATLDPAEAPLPSYVASVNATGVTKTNYDSVVEITDPRAPSAPGAVSADVQQRGAGLWLNRGTASAPGSFSVTITVAAPTSFNLSVYSHALDQSPQCGYDPVAYYEQFGCFLRYDVADANGTRAFYVYNNAPGVWATFPVVTTAAGDTVQITVTAIYPPNPYGYGTVQAQIAALAFDPYETRQTTYAYNATGQLTSVTDPLNQTTGWSYNADGTLATATDARGNTTHYHYGDAYKNLTRVVDPSGAIWRLSYDENGNLLTIEDPKTNVISMAYDAKNRLISYTDALNHTTVVVRDDDGRVIKVTDPLAHASGFGYTPAGRPQTVTDALEGTTTFAYHPSGLLDTTTDPRGSATAFSYDAANRLMRVTLPDTGSGPQTITLASDEQDRIRAVTTPNGTQADASAIVLDNGANLLRNPGAEIAEPTNPDWARSWANSAGGSANDRDSSHHHTGEYSLPASLAATTVQSWSQIDLALPAGSRYLANVWVQASGDSVPSQLKLATTYHNSTVADTSKSTDTAHSTSSFDGSSSEWQQLPAPLLFYLPADGMYTRFTTTELQAELTNESTTQPTELWLDDFLLTPLSTTYNYDIAGGIQEVRNPAGSRIRYFRDRFGRVVSLEDPNGGRTNIGYDVVDRVTSVADPLDNESTFGYDAVGNLQSFTDPRGDETTYQYNSRNLLETITYPDNTTEQFGYDSAGNLSSYVDNQGRNRSFGYDANSRPTSVTYSDGTSVVIAYDAAGNLKTTTERNGDVTRYHYDALNRLVGEARIPAANSVGPAWAQSQTYDAASNRTSLSLSPAVYGKATYGAGTYGSGPVYWSVPSPGYDAWNQMPGYQDSLGNQTTFSYDVEGRRNGIVYPFGSPAVATTAAYDIAGRLLRLVTAQGSNSVLSLDYGYDQASNRVGMVAGSDTWDYDLDAADRLVHAYLNQFVEQLATHFAMGTCGETEVDSATPSVQLVPLNDSFSGSELNVDRWRPAYPTQDFLGLEIRQSDGLLMAFPCGFTDTVCGYPVSQGWAAPYGVYFRVTYGVVELRTQLGGDLDIQVDFSDFQGYGTFANAGLYVRDTPAEVSPTLQLYIRRQGINEQTQNYQAGVTGGGGGSATVATTDTSGKLRIQRDGTTGDVTLSYYSGGAWQTLVASTWPTVGNLYVGLILETDTGAGSVRWANFTVTQPSTQYAASGTYMSSVYDAGRTPTWGTLDWAATTPTGTAVQFQLASSDSPNGPWSFLGPTGDTSYYTTSGTAIPSSGPGAITGRYLRYQATLSGDGTATPVLTRVQVTFSGDNPTTEYDYSYDAAGNLTSVGTITAAGTATEVRDNASWPAGDQINDLNQILRNDVTPAGGSATTYRYTYNADGTLAAKTDGTTTWTYNWDPVGTQRLLNVEVDGVTQVAYTYDSLGRMLTRTPYSGGAAGTPTSFEWDGMTVVRETTPGGVYRYYAPQGELITFDYTPNGGATASYSAHADAIGSIRAITDSTGALVAHFEYDAWGTLLPTSDFGPLPDWSYLFVGSLGVRWDGTTGLYYMRQRWYDAGLQRFVSRDPLGITGGQDLYAYVADAPTNLVDSAGLGPISYGLTPQNRALIERAIRQIQSLGYWRQAAVIEMQLRTGRLGVLHSWINAGGFTNPFTKSIGVESGCFTHESNQWFVFLTATLFHEATHYLTQGRFKLFFEGIAADWFGYPPAMTSLETPVYTAERSFLRTWLARQPGNMPSAVRYEIGRLTGQITSQRANARAWSQGEGFIQGAGTLWTGWP